MKKTILVSIINSFVLLSLLLSFPACSSDDDKPDASTSEWVQPNPENYEYTMTYVSQVSINGVINQSEKTEIAAFSADECRGKAFLKHEKNLGIYLCYLTIFSNTVSGETITLKVFDGENKAIYENVLTLDFANNKTMGSADNVLNCNK